MPKNPAQQNISNIPKLRFPGFDGVWEEKRLGEVAKFFSGGTPTSSSKKYYDGTIPFIKSGEISDDKTDQFINELALKDSSAKLVETGDLLYALYGATSGEVAISKISGAINQAVLCIRTDQDKKWLLSYLYFQKGRILARYLQGGQGNLSADIIKNLKISFPELPEQQKIASFLGSVDEWIANLRAQHAEIAQYKKGMMQKIFSQQIRFKDDKGNDFPEWDEKRLGDCLEYEQPTPYIVESTEYDNSFKIPVLTAGKSFILGYTNETNGIYKDLPVIIFDDFTTTSQFVDFPFKVKSSAMKILKAKEGSEIKFIFEVMQQIKYEIGGHGRHWISKYSNIKIKIPSLPEQLKIAEFLSSVDQLLESKQQQINHAEQWKKGLIQGLFV